MKTIILSILSLLSFQISFGQELICPNYSVHCSDPDLLNENYFELYEINGTPDMPGHIASGIGGQIVNLWIPFNVDESFKEGAILKDIQINADLIDIDVQELQIKLHVPLGLSNLGIPAEMIVDSFAQVEFSNIYNTSTSEALNAFVNNYDIPAQLLTSENAEDFYTETSGSQKPYNYGKTWYIHFQAIRMFTGGIPEFGGQVNSARLELSVAYPKPINPNGSSADIELISETLIESSCDAPNFSPAQIHRVYSWTDENGEIRTCEQSIDLIPPSLDEINWPKDVTIDCGEGISPSDIQTELLTEFYAGEDYTESAFEHCNLIISWEDIELAYCGGFRLIRDWTVTNLCQGNFRKHAQRIDVLDTSPPIAEINSISSSTSEFNCTASVILADLNLIDHCSEISLAEAKYLISGNPSNGNDEYNIVDLLNSGSIDGLELGENTVELKVEDACQNADVFNLTINVVDNIIPKANCKQGLNFTIENNEPWKLYAIDFDDSSTDNCGINKIEIRSQECIGEEWADYIDIASCESGIFDVEIRVTDASGNTAICSSEIEVVNQFVDNLQCRNYAVYCNDPDALNEDYFEVYEIEAAPEMPGNIVSGWDSLAANLWIPFNVEFCPRKGEVLKDISILVQGTYREVSKLAVYLHIPSLIATKYDIPQSLTLSKIGESGSTHHYTSDSNGTAKDLRLLFEQDGIISFDLQSKVIREDFFETLGGSLPEYYGQTWYIQMENSEMNYSGPFVASQLYRASIELVLGFPKPDFGEYNHSNAVEELIIESPCNDSNWSNAEIHRTYSTTDQNGNLITCEQIVQLIPPALEDLQMPVDITVDCTDGLEPSDFQIEMLGQLYACWDYYESDLDFCNLIVSWEDIVEENCNAFSLLRNWSFTNFCEGRTINHVQKIDVVDRTPPELLSEPVSISTIESDCHAVLALSDLGLVDACSELEEVSVKYLISGNPYLGNAVYEEVDLLNGDSVTGLGLGENLVEIRLMDSCLNSDTIEITVQVEDKMPPVITCMDSYLRLDENGNGRIHIDELDFIHYDNCDDNAITEIRSLGCISNSWGQMIDFAACDAGKTEVEVKATDSAGNFSICKFIIKIIDPFNTSPENDQEYEEGGFVDEELSGFSNEDDLEFKKFPNQPENQFEIYPNPFSESCFISFFSDSNSSSQITVYNSLGQRVFERAMNYKKGYNKFEIQKEELGGTGNFFLELRNNGIQEIQKLILLEN